MVILQSQETTIRKKMASMIDINILWDDEAKVWIAICNEIGLALESKSYDVLLGRVRLAAPEMAELNRIDYTDFNIITMTKNERN